MKTAQMGDPNGSPIAFLLERLHKSQIPNHGDTEALRKIKGTPWLRVSPGTTQPGLVRSSKWIRQ